MLVDRLELIVIDGTFVSLLSFLVERNDGFSVVLIVGKNESCNVVDDDDDDDDNDDGNEDNDDESSDLGIDGHEDKEIDEVLFTVSLFLEVG